MSTSTAPAPQAPAGSSTSVSSTAAGIVKTTVDTIRCLSMDAVQAANSGHPGTPMALAPVTYQLWQNHLRFDPNDPIWPNRDRFVLSAGHASMLLYSMLHLTGVKAVNAKYEMVGELAVPLDEIKKFRQLDSKCPGHPEYRWTSGVETTTGPLGQGYANSVGMAIAGKWLAATYNRPNFEMFDYNVYAIGGDGCMMEGAASEAASLAGHLKLDNLCWIYDNNEITIEGKTSLAFSEDVATRFIAYGWNVTRVGDANDLQMLERAFQVFKQTNGRPTLIIVDSHIGWGAPTKQGTHGAHGEPLGDKEIEGAKKSYGFPTEPKFLVPDGVREHFAGGIGKRGGEARGAWMAKYEQYKAAYAKEARELLQMQHRELPDGWDKEIPTFPADAKGMAGRDASGKVLNAIAKQVPWLIGGSADLAPSTKTRLTFDGAGDFGPPALTPQTGGTDSHGAHHATEVFSFAGRNFHYGVRELAMAGVVNGMSLSKVRAFGAGFFVFSDFGRPAIRLSAIMEIPTIHVFTHDSIGVGEDGPTHQPIEHLASLRAIPGLLVIRPGDANEMAECWRVIMKTKHHPVCLVTTRQAMPTLDRTKYNAASGAAKGAYVLACAAPDGKPDVLLIATGSEVSLAADAYEKLKAEGVKARVVSMPSWELFENQDQAYRDGVLPPTTTARVAVELGSTFGWERYVGQAGVTIGMKSFGASAPIKDVIKKFGFTVENVVSAAKEQVSKSKR
ncbi:MAG TPA: transketolase [Tepidisphaeraceae bacterium]|nr:transketolase [Tepidisphaeraceae bacterium]